MGRGKIEIKRIENQTNRHVTFSKRKNGIIKKARELNVLCEAQISLVVISSNGKMSEFNSTRLEKTLEKYQKASGKNLWDAKHEYLSKELDRIKKENDCMQIELRHLKGEDLTSLQPRELIPIEDALSNGLRKVKDKQMEFWENQKQRIMKLEEDHKVLSYTSQKQEQLMEMNGNLRGLENGFHHQNGGEYPSQMPFTFRVQPIQPNLQENK